MCCVYGHMQACTYIQHACNCDYCSFDSSNWSCAAHTMQNVYNQRTSGQLGTIILTARLHYYYSNLPCVHIYNNNGSSHWIWTDIRCICMQKVVWWPWLFCRPENQLRREGITVRSYHCQSVTANELAHKRSVVDSGGGSIWRGVRWRQRLARAADSSKSGD